MANHPSADKRNRQRITRTARNRAIESSVKTVVKRVHTALTEKNKDGATRALAIAVKALDKEFILDLLGIEIGPVRLKCALLSLKALKAGAYGIEAWPE